MGAERINVRRGRLERLGMQLGREREIIEQSYHLRAHKGPVRALKMSEMGANLG
jgi:hypothetical protein